MLKFRLIRFCIGLIISLIFLYFALREFDWNHAFIAFQQARYLYVFPALIMYLFALWMRTYRWTFLLPPGIKISTYRLFPIFILGCFANNILPLRMGDLYRACLLSKKENTSKSIALASVFVDKVFDALAVLTILGVAAFLLSARFPDWERHLLRFAAIILLSGVLLLWLILWNRPMANKIIRWILSHLSSKPEKLIKNILYNFLDGLELLKNHRLVIKAFLISIISWLIEAVMYYLIAVALGTYLPYYAAPVILAVVNLALMIPASPAGIGTFQFFCIKTAEPFFPTYTHTAIYAIFVHLAWFLPITLMGLYYLWKKHISFKEIQLSELNNIG